MTTRTPDQPNPMERGEGGGPHGGIERLRAEVANLEPGPWEWHGDDPAWGGISDHNRPFVAASRMYVSLLLDVAEAARDIGTGCQLAPGADRDWCVTHQEWSYRGGPPCPNEALAQALDRLGTL